MDVQLELKQKIETMLDKSSSLKYCNISEDDSLVTVLIETTGSVDEKTLKRNVIKIIKIDYGFNGAKVSIERKKEKLISSKTKYITVTSGKGGVGKSTVSANLASSLAKFGYRIGIIDADVYGASVPKVFGMNNPRLLVQEDNKIIPPLSEEGVFVMSTEFLVEDDKPLMWRGPMLGRMLNHLFDDVAWPTDLDFMIIDLPPGTGDIPLTLKDMIPEALAIVVTTPNRMASEIAIKSGEMAKALGHELLGVVENMSYFINPVNGNHEPIFGVGGGLEVANKLETEVLAEISIAQVKDGKTSGIFTSHEENGLIYLGLANKVLKKFNENKSN